jgi:hypothetical protein
MVMTVGPVSTCILLCLGVSSIRVVPFLLFVRIPLSIGSNRGAARQRELILGNSLTGERSRGNFRHD